MELWRGVEQFSRAGDLPLRFGRSSKTSGWAAPLSTPDPAFPATADRLGRRIFSGLVVAASTLGGATAFAHEYTLGGTLLAVAGTILVLHVLLNLRRRSKSLD